MFVSKKTLAIIVAAYVLMAIIFFFLSVFQEVSITHRFNWSVIYTDFVMDTAFLTIAFIFFFYLLNKVQAGNSTILAQQERYRQALDNMKEGIQMLDSEWRYTYLNDAAVSQSKYSRKELIGHTIIEKYPEVEHTPLFERMRACLRDQVVAEIENEFVYPDGSKGFFELFIEPIPGGLFILSLDISERRKREQERSRRIAETHEILFKISHEVRQPVVGLQGLADTIDHNLVSADELGMVCNMMKDSLALLDTRTRDLSEYVHSLVVE